MKSRVFNLSLVTLIFIGCASVQSPPRATICAIDASRRPAAFTCIEAVSDNQSKTASPTAFAYVNQLISDFATQSRFVQILNSLRSSGADKSPVGITDRLARIRESLLPVFKMGIQEAEGFTRAMESELRDQSFRYKKALAARVGSAEKDQYDYVIVGGSVHGIIALAKILREKPNARVLVIDGSETMGSTFRLLSDIFRINSSSRPSGPGNRPLPGEGNLNELPELLLQVSELSQGKYPSSGDLGRALVAAAHSLISSNPNVRLLLRSEVETINNLSGDSKLSWKLKTKFSVSEESVTTEIHAQNIVIASGLGLPTYPPKFVKFLQENPQLLTSNDVAKKLPKIVTFEDLLRLVALSENPKDYFKNMKIDVIGTGDSANVFIEFLLGYAPDAAYGYSDGQVPQAKLIRWIGQSAETCEEFVRTARSRYVQIGTGFRSSSPKVPAILKGFGAKADSLFLDGQGNLALRLDDGKSISGADLTVVTTGFEGQLHKVFAELFPGNDTDKKVLENIPFVEAPTSVSDGKKTRVGRSIRSAKGGAITIVGPSAGQLAQSNELVGIIQNFVSIFNNAPRTVAAIGQMIANTLSVEIPLPKTADLQIDLQETPMPAQMLVTEVQPIRHLSTSSQSYIIASLKTFLNKITLPATNRGAFRLEIKYIPETGNLLLESPEKINLRPLVESMASTKDFFAQIQSILEPYAGAYRMEVVVPVSGRELVAQSMRLDYVANNVSGAPSQVMIVQNAQPILRGLEKQNISQLRQTVAAIDPRAVQPRVGQTVYVGSNKSVIEGITPGGLYSAKNLINFGLRSNINRDEIYVEGNLFGITTGDECIYNSIKVKIVGINPNGLYAAFNTVAGNIISSISRADLAIKGSSTGVSTGETAYYNSIEVIIAGVYPNGNFALYVPSTGAIINQIPRSNIAVKGTANGISTGDKVIINNKPAIVLGVTPSGTYTVKFTGNGSIATGFSRSSIAKKLPD